MAHDYSPLIRKLKLLARPRLHVEAAEDMIRISLLRSPASPDSELAAFGFRYKGDRPPAEQVLMALSAFLETAALMLERRSPGKHPSAFAQDLYNAGFWTHAANGSDVLECQIEALEYDQAKWD